MTYLLQLTEKDLDRIQSTIEESTHHFSVGANNDESDAARYMFRLPQGVFFSSGLLNFRH